MTTASPDGWGAIANADEALHVRVGGSDSGGDGSKGNPFATLHKAVATIDGRRGQQPDSAFISVGPGTWSANLDLEKHGDNPRLYIEGCSPDESVVVSASSTKAVLEVDHRDVTVRGLALEGGRMGVFAHDHASVDLQGVRVQDATRVGIYGKHHAKLGLSDVQVTSSKTDDGLFGWGIALAQKSEALLAGVQVVDSTGIGIFADDSKLDLSDVQVAWTQPAPNGKLGRGVHLQHKTDFTIRDSLIVGNQDAGLFILNAIYIDVGRIIIDITGAGIIDRDGIIIDLPGSGIIGDGKKTGDGIVIIGDPGTKNAWLYDNEIYSSKRAAMLFEGAEADVSGTTAIDNGFEIAGSSLFRQNGAAVSGADAGRVQPLEGIERLQIKSNDLPIP